MLLLKLLFMFLFHNKTLSQNEMEMSDVNSLLRKVEENCDKKIAQIEQDIVERDRIYEKRMVQMEKELEDRVSKLEQLAKIGTLRTCAEYTRYGLKSSGMYNIDPDGPLLGREPFQVFCNFETGATEVLHDSENLTVVDHCHDPGNITEN